MDDKFDLLLEDLQKDNFEIMNKERQQAVIKLPDSDNVFIFLLSGDWLQVAAVLIENIELDKYLYRNLIGEIVLRIHSRYLGCRIGYDEDANLTIQNDIYPENQEGRHVAQVLWQMNYIGSAILPLIQETLLNGKFPNEEELDQSFLI